MTVHKRRPVMNRRTPRLPAVARVPQQHTRLTRALLHTRLLHHLIDQQVCELRYATPTTGRLADIPLRYASGGERLIALIPHTERKDWPTTFTKPYPVRVLLEREWRPARAWLAAPGQPGWNEARRVYDRCFPDATGDSDLFLAVTLAASAVGSSEQG